MSDSQDFQDATPLLSEERDATDPRAPQPSPRTPADRMPVPAPDAFGHFELDDPACFLNRELTWLGFNFRVLQEADDERNPVLERLKFISIVGSNLDQFFMKRIGGLKQQVGAGVRERTKDGRTPEEQIAECCELERLLETRIIQVLRRLRDDLAKHDIHYAAYDELTAEERLHLRNHYIENIFPLVTPQATDPAHPFPFISNLSLNLLVSLHYPNDSQVLLARVKVPLGSGIPRLLKLEDRNTFVPLESVMAGNLDLLFPDMEIDTCHLFRVTRNANTERNEENADDLLELIESEMRDRKFAPIVRLEVGTDMDPYQRGMLAAELGVDESMDVFEFKGFPALRDLIEMTTIGDALLRDPPHHPVDHPAMESDRNIFHTIRDAGSILLQHPYESYATSVERFLREASRNPKVRAIKMTLYRTSSDSNVIDYLIDAAHNGKQVAVVLELKAMFDEEANIRWASRLEEAGVHVTYGVVGLKTHCKLILVVRQDYDGIRRYAHVGTGNYHAGTARIYADVGLLTCDLAIGRDLTELMNYLTTGYKPKRSYEKILPAPKICKNALLTKLQREISLHEEGSPGHIQIKVNALEDADVIRALYRASQAGVKIDLIVRDSCCLRPGVPGLSDNIRAVSIVGRFLEHARVYYFRNGGSEEFYIGSADCMTRNLVSRVEILVPVEHPPLQEELRFLLTTQLEDERSAWEMQSDGSYVQRMPTSDRKRKGCQQISSARAEKQLHEVTRLRRRRPRLPGHRNAT